MRVVTTRQRNRARAPAADGRPAQGLRPLGRFAAHLVEMCMVMCVGAIVLSVLFFGAAAMLGYTNLPQTATELSVLVIALNLSVPMVVWMRFRGMAWQPTLEMGGATMVVGLALIGASRLGLVAEDSLIGIQTSLACPVMLGVMLFRFRLYSQGHAAHSGRHAHAG